MTAAPAPPTTDDARSPGSGGRRRWLRADEGWAPSEEAVRLLGALVVALAAIALKVLIVRVLGGELGYLSYVGAVALAAWIAGMRGGFIATMICALAEAALFTGSIGRFIEQPLTIFRLALFLADGVLVTLITAQLRLAMVRERSARATGEERLEAQAAAYRTAERDRAALARLQAVTASLAGAATPTEVADAILDRGLLALGACAGGVSRLSDDGAALELLSVRGYPEHVTEHRSRFDLAGRSHLRDAVTSGVPVFLTEPDAWARRYPDSPPVDLPESGTGAIAVLPLRAGGRTIGTVVFRFAAPEALGEATRDLAERLADQGAQALDRALIHERERTGREALQRSAVRLTFVAQASELLASGAGLDSGLAAVSRLPIPALADWVAIRLVDQGLDVRAQAAASPDGQPDLEALVAIAPLDLGTWPAPGLAPRGGYLSAPAGWSGLVDDLRAASLLERLSTRSLLAAPIGVPGSGPSGWIGLGRSTPDGFEPDDLSMLRDVAGRIAVAAEQERLFAAVARFKATLDVAEDAVYMFEPDTQRLTYVNLGGANLVGFDAGDLAARSVVDLQPAGHRTAFRARLGEVRRAPGHSVTFTGALERSDGRQIPVDARLQLVILPDGTRTAILTARDITERIEVQARLARIAGDERRKAAELRAVLRAIGEGIMVVDSSERISLVNEAAAAILGGEVPGTLAELEARIEIGSAAPTDSHEEASAPHIDADVRSRTIGIEDGRWLEITIYPADLGGPVTEDARESQIVVLRDVTRAREAEAAREAFLGVLSHELRTPVTTIFGWAKVLQRPGHRRDQAEMLADIEAEADRLYRIVEDLLALTRVEGGFRIEGEPLLLQHVTSSLVASESRRMPAISVEVDIPQDLPAVFGERTYVEQVLRNLLSNAGKYSPPGTTVTIEAEATPDEVVIRVLDRGQGIDPEEADRLFDLYYRSNTTARKVEGAGIGLYIGRGLITAMGGHIWARPRPGGGSEFGFSLPRCDSTGASASLGD